MVEVYGSCIVKRLVPTFRLYRWWENPGLTSGCVSVIVSNQRRELLRGVRNFQSVLVLLDINKGAVCVMCCVTVGVR